MSGDGGESLEHARKALRLWMVHTQESKGMQPTATVTAQTAAPAPEQAGLERQQEALVGRLIAEAEEAECIAADMQEQLQQLQCAKRCSRVPSLQSKCSHCISCLRCQRWLKD